MAVKIPTTYLSRQKKRGEFFREKGWIGGFNRTCKRLTKEFYRRKTRGLGLGSEGVANIEIYEENGKYDPHKWIITIIGPEGTPYENGVFKFEFIFPDDGNWGSSYPFRPPKIFTLQKIYHTSYSPEKNSLLPMQYHPISDQWRASLGVVELIVGLIYLFTEPGNGCQNEEAVKLLDLNPKKFNKIARLYTKKYANHIPWTCYKSQELHNIEDSKEREDFFKEYFQRKEENMVFITQTKAHLMIRTVSFDDDILIPKWL